MSSDHIPLLYVDRDVADGVTLATWRRDTVAAEDRVREARAAWRGSARRRLFPRLGTRPALRPRFV
ncbi:MAG TPA: hypothetical protein VGW75_07375 [Solirubrobacteraceae bacterium]|nr:hypothetical protein [Solirubrobacteraceae bacterium]